MSSSRDSSIITQPKGRRVIDLSLPQTPFGYESDFEMDFDATSADLPSPPSSAESFACIGDAEFSDVNSFASPGLGPDSGDWLDETVLANAAVTIEGDGTQLIHIPYESPFYYSPGSSQSLGFPHAPRESAASYSSYSTYHSSSSSSSWSSCPRSVSAVSRATLARPQREGALPLIITQTPSPTSEDDVDDENCPEIDTQASRKPPRGAMLLVDTHFLSPPSTNIAFANLPSPFYFSDGSNSGSSSGAHSPWFSERKGDSDLDVPYSAITPVSPSRLPFWFEKDAYEPLKHLPNESTGVC